MARSMTVAFVCLHGSAKSLIAPEYFGRIAAQRGLDARGTNAGPEPDAEIPANVVEGLLARGFDVRGKRPAVVTADALAQADHIVSFGCDLGALVGPGRAIERWDDCPAVSEDFGTAWNFITLRVEQMTDRIDP